MGAAPVISLIQDVILPLIGVLVAVLLGILAWLGARLHARVDEIPAELSKINETLFLIEGNLKKELASHDTRLSVVEAKMTMYHGRDQ